MSWWGSELSTTYELLIAEGCVNLRILKKNQCYVYCSHEDLLDILFSIVYRERAPEFVEGLTAQNGAKEDTFGLQAAVHLHGREQMSK